ncbi:MAG: isovaleryl-CoA dehydrogenase [Candidatus Hydrogenedentes bacterium]|nr:isovaleryl-CoA dehydrogenase [Candidatus Hydrogenedentota bacterium]
MAIEETSSPYQTHEVLNQPPPLEKYNPYAADTVLREGVKREGAAWADADLLAFGQQTGQADFIKLGFLANTCTPVLRTHDRFGHRLDVIEYHPAWHELMRAGVQQGVHALPWREAKRGAHVARAVKHFLLTQVEAGVGCPLTMTFAAAPALHAQPEIAAEWLPRITSLDYDPRFLPAQEKTGCIMGMAMTEKQGGSDVRANTTQAVAIGAEGPGEEYLLTGHKWFCSAPMCDAFLTLAQSDGGLSCFIVPRWLPDGTKNRVFIQRLKDKLGNRSNASGEIEFLDTWARMVGEEGRGVPTIIEMVNHTRLDCVIGSAALMRQALVQAIHHCRHRSAFGKLLIDQPLMRNVLADLALESEAATLLMLRLARGYDAAAADPAQRPLVRLMTAIAKYWVCKRTPAMVYEALECLGGAGYVEESIFPRLYREAPLSSIWEGSGNVICLDVLRAIAREPEALPALLQELKTASGADPHYDRRLKSLEENLHGATDREAQARYVVEQLALAIQANLLIQHAPDSAARAFCRARLERAGGMEYGTMPAPHEETKNLDYAFRHSSAVQQKAT